jgi:hypothetical protein
MLLIRRNAFLVLDLSFDVFNPVSWFDFEVTIPGLADPLLKRTSLLE